MITMSPSLTHRIYLISRARYGEGVTKGDYVMFVYTYNNEPINITKVVSCTTGDELRESNGNYFCNGRYIGTAKDYSLKGEKLERFRFRGIVPPGKLFVTGQHRDSYDSKYIGFIEEKYVKAIAYPIF